MRKVLYGVLVIGVFLIVMPFAMGLPSKSASGEEMIDAFGPIMDEQNVQTTADYYYNVFVPLGDVAPAMSQDNIDTFNAYLDGFGGLGTEAQNLAPAFAEATGLTEEQVGEYMATQFPAMMQILQGLPQMQQDFAGLLGLMGANVAIFEQVPAGLAHYEPLVTTMQEQQQNYEDIASLPDFRSFTWFFVIPGVLLVGLAGYGLFAGRKEVAAVAVRPVVDENRDEGPLSPPSEKAKVGAGPARS